MRLYLFIITALAFAISVPARAYVPVPGAKYDKLVVFDGPGPFCAAVLSIALDDGEFVLARRSNSWSVQYQIELTDGRIMLFNSMSGLSEGKKGKKVGEGQLIKMKDNEDLTYRYDNGVPGTSLLSGFNIKKREGKKLLNRIRFSSPKYDLVNEQPCLKGLVVK